MKRLSTLLILLFTLSVFSQKSKRIKFEKEYYWGFYSEVFEQPLYIEYEVYHCDYGESRTGIKFFRDKKIHTSDNGDYYKNPWDRGHLVPAASQNCTYPMIKETFNYLNCALQYYSLNRGVWKELEKLERELASQYNKVTVQIKVAFGEGSKRLNTGAIVPSGFYKTIILDNGSSVYEYYFPNIDPIYKDYEKYQIYNK
jgi:DNA/RNA endonuclease G (NUC1)